MISTIPRYPAWVTKNTPEDFMELRNSSLAQPGHQVEVVYDEYHSIIKQIEELEAKRLEMKRAGADAIICYQVAYCNLFLERVRESGKEYCQVRKHIVSEINVQLLWDRGYYVMYVCPECLQEIQSKGRCGGNRYELLEMKEEEGVRFGLRKGEWKQLPEEWPMGNFSDYVSGKSCYWVSEDLGKQYGMPIQLSIL